MEYSLDPSRSWKDIMIGSLYNGLSVIGYHYYSPEQLIITLLDLVASKS